MQSSSQIITTNKSTSSFLQAGCPSCRPTNSVKALKGKISHSMDLLTPSSPGVFQLVSDHLWARIKCPIFLTHGVCCPLSSASKFCCGCSDLIVYVQLEDYFRKLKNPELKVRVEQYLLCRINNSNCQL